MLNKIVIMGRLTRDPELRYTQSGKAVANFTVAVDRDFKNQDGSRSADFIDCVAWGQGGEFVSRNYHKGSSIVVEGSLQSRQWQDRDGNKRVNLEIVAEHTYFGESKRRDEDSRSDSYGENYGSYGAGRDSAPAPAPRSGFEEVADDDGDLPF